MTQIKMNYQLESFISLKEMVKIGKILKFDETINGSNVNTGNGAFLQIKKILFYKMC